MEGATTKELRGTIELLDTIERQDLNYDAVSGRQIIGALLQEAPLLQLAHHYEQAAAVMDQRPASELAA